MTKAGFHNDKECYEGGHWDKALSHCNVYYCDHGFIYRIGSRGGIKRLGVER